MAKISAEETQRRHQVNASVIGTSAMEGLQLDNKTLSLMRRFAEGDLTREELSAAIDQHVAHLAAELTGGANLAKRIVAGAA